MEHARSRLARETQRTRVETVLVCPLLAKQASRLLELLESGRRPGVRGQLESELGRFCDDLGRDPGAYRESIGHQFVPDSLSTAEALRRIDAYRWIERVAHHSWRIEHHLAQLRHALPTRLIAEPPEPD